MGLAHQVSVVAAVAVRLAQRPHRLGQRRERRQRVRARCPRGRPAVLDDVLPPALGVVVTGRLGEHADGVDPNVGGVGDAGDAGDAGCIRGVGRRPAKRLRRLGFPLPLGLLRRHGQGMHRGQIDETDRDLALQGPAQRHPLRGELGQRPERRAPRVVHDVGEQRHRWPHVGMQGQRQQGIRLGRALYQHRGRRGRLQRGPHRTRRPGAVVPYPEQHRLRRRPGGHALTSRQAR